MLVDTGSTATTYIASGLSSGTYYSFAIKASNLIGFSDLSAVGSIICATKPDAPINLALVSQSQTTIVVSWASPVNTGGTPLTGFKIKWNASGSMQILDSTIGPTTY